jgi:hypothetical protein
MIWQSISKIAARGSMILMLLLFLAAGPGFTASYLAYEHFGDGIWHDANKTGTDDSLMCWAASASNVLDFARWDTAAYSNQTAIFTNFKAHWTNQGSLAGIGWRWWFDGVNEAEGVSGWAQVNVSGGGNHWSGYNFSNFFSQRWVDDAGPTPDLMAYLDQQLHLGKGATLNIYRSKLDAQGNEIGWKDGHALTAWGYDLAATYTDVFVTDSDDADGVTGLREVAVNFNSVNGRWYLTNYAGGGYFIGGVHTLAQRVPEPGTLFLLALGLFGFAATRGRMKD